MEILIKGQTMLVFQFQNRSIKCVITQRNQKAYNHYVRSKYKYVRIGTLIKFFSNKQDNCKLSSMYLLYFSQISQ